jgi:hypothetical protein
MMFFTKDGAYGERTPETDEEYAGTDRGWMAIPTWHWTPEMLQRIADVDDEVRYAVAQDFSMGIHKMNAVKMVCYTCGLAMEQLNESALMEGWNKEYELSLSIDE